MLIKEKDRQTDRQPTIHNNPTYKNERLNNTYPANNSRISLLYCKGEHATHLISVT